MKMIVATLVAVALVSGTALKAEPVGPSPKSTAKPYVLKWKTRGWVKIDYQFQKGGGSLIGKGVDDKIAEAKDLGFGTKKEIDHTVVLFGDDSYRTYAYAKRDKYKEKSFKTKKERDAYKRMLYKLVPSYTNDGPGLITKEETR